jgi:N-acetyl-gamma-glutamyl-phosphate reductase/acetylglutamate kinase
MVFRVRSPCNIFPDHHHLMYIELCIELYGRDALRTAKRISNPRCYATAVQTLLAPLLPHIAPGSMPTVFGVSGYSGAGTVTGPNNETGRPMTLAKVTAESLRGGLKPYALTDHIHEREARRHLSCLLPPGSPPLKVAFTSTVAPWLSGILALASVPLAASLTARDVWALFEAQYKGERLVRLQRDAVVPRDIERRHGVCVGGVQVQSPGEHVAVTGGLDNLLKGAVTQCLQVRGGCGVMSQIVTDGSAEPQPCAVLR